MRDMQNCREIPNMFKDVGVTFTLKAVYIEYGLTRKRLIGITVNIKPNFNGELPIQSGNILGLHSQWHQARNCSLCTKRDKFSTFCKALHEKE